MSSLPGARVIFSLGVCVRPAHRLVPLDDSRYSDGSQSSELFQLRLRRRERSWCRGYRVS